MGNVARSFLAVLILILATTRPARADSTSLATIGAGVSGGATRDIHDGAVSRGMSGDVSVMVRCPRFLAAEITYSPFDRVVSEGEALMDSRFRLSGRLYLVPTYPVGFYLKGGVGAATPARWFPASTAGNSYHAGAGLDIHTGEHLVTALEVLGDIPSFGSWDRAGLAEDHSAIGLVRHLRMRGSIGMRYFL